VVFSRIFGRKTGFPVGTEYSPADSGYNVWYFRAYANRFDVLCVRDPSQSAAERKVGLHVKRDLIQKSDPDELTPLLNEFRKSGRFIVQSYDDGTAIVVARSVQRLPDEFKPILDKTYQDKRRG
jgi:hypothetical protein